MSKIPPDTDTNDPRPDCSVVYWSIAAEDHDGYDFLTCAFCLTADGLEASTFGSIHPCNESVRIFW